MGEWIISLENSLSIPSERLLNVPLHTFHASFVDFADSRIELPDALVNKGFPCGHQSWKVPESSYIARLLP